VIWLVVVFVFVAVPAGAAIWVLNPPKYKARGVIHVKPNITPLVFKADETGRYSDFKNSQVGHILHPDVIQRVLEDVSHTAWYAEKPLFSMGLKSRRKRLLDGLEVRPRPRTEFIDVSFDTADPNDAVLIVRSLLDRYIKQHEDERKRDRKDLYDKLVEAETGERSRIEAIRTVIRESRKRLRGDPERLIGEARSRLDASRALLGEVRRQFSVAELELRDMARDFSGMLPALADETRESLYRRLVGEHIAVARDLADRKEKMAEGGNAGGGLSEEEIEAQIKAREWERDFLEDRLLEAAADALPSPSREAIHEALERALRAPAKGLGGSRPVKGPRDEDRRGDASSGGPATKPAVNSPGKPPAVSPGPVIADPPGPLTANGPVREALWKQRELLQAAGDRPQPASAPATSQPARLYPYEQDAEWMRLRADARAAERQYEVARMTYQDEHPQVDRLAKLKRMADDNLRARERELGERMRRLSSSRAGGAGVTGKTDLLDDLNKVRRDARALRHREHLLAKQVAEQERRFAVDLATAQELAKAQDELHQKLELYEALRSRKEQKQLEKQYNPARISVQAYPQRPEEPSSRRRLLYIAAAVIGILGTTTGLVFVWARGKTELRAADDLPLAIRRPFLEVLPLVKAKRTSVEDDPVLEEGMRMLRTALLPRLGSEPGSSVLVTSAEARAGKSTVTWMLAKSLASCGKRVLVVDADLRNSSLSAKLELGAQPGLVESLYHKADDLETVFGTSTPGLSVMPSGQPDDGRELELIANGAFSACLDRWRHQYDVILLDSPPVLAAADARILSQQADSILLVTRERNSHPREVEEAIAYLAACGGQLLGAVYIGSEAGGGYGRYYARGYYARGKQ